MILDTQANDKSGSPNKFKVIPFAEICCYIALLWKKHLYVNLSFFHCKFKHLYVNLSLFHCKFKQNCNLCSIFIQKLLVTASKVIHRHSPSLKCTTAGISYFRPKIRTNFFLIKKVKIWFIIQCQTVGQIRQKCKGTSNWMWLS